MKSKEYNELIKDLKKAVFDSGMGHWIVPKILEVLKKYNITNDTENLEEHY